MESLPATLCAGCELCWRDTLRTIDDNKSLFQFLVDHGVILSQFMCPDCSKSCSLDPISLSWDCLSCIEEDRKGRKSSVALKSFFSLNDIDIGTALFFVHLWLTVPKHNEEFLEEQTGLSKETIELWSSRCQEVCVHWAADNALTLGGSDSVVEIEEVALDFYCGRNTPSKFAYFGLERGTKKGFLVTSSNHSAEGLLPIIRKYIFQGTTLSSDVWDKYDCLDSEPFEYLKQTHFMKFTPNDNSKSCEDLKTYVTQQCGDNKSLFAKIYAHCLFENAVDPLHRLHSFLLAAGDFYSPSN